MHRLSFLSFRIHRSIFPGLTLCFCWLAGISLGLLADRFYGAGLGEIVLTAGAVSPGLLDLSLVTLVSLLFAACAVLIFHRFGAYMCASLRGFFLGFVLGGAVSAAGVLYGLLLLFSGLMFGPVVLVYLRRRLAFGMLTFLPDTAFCAGIGLLIAAVDALVVSPFLAAAMTI